MTKKTRKNLINFATKVLPYMVAAAAIIGIVTIGSIDREHKDTTLNLSMFTEEDYTISTDQLSELYIVASLSSALNLASTDDVASNYVITTALYRTGQASAEKIAKPTIIDDGLVRNHIETYVVKAGETMDAIASRYGITTDQIRWSNKLKNKNIKEGDTLYIPTVSGIVYTVKKGDTVESIASTYGSNADEIISFNDLELSGISEGMRILIKDGSLPEKERPEYVPPAPVIHTTTTYTYLGSTSERQNIQVIGYNYYGGGQCVGYALWYRNVSGRSTNPKKLPTNWGNANAWANRAAAAGFRVDREPEVDAIFQTSRGWYGHVGVVVGKNEDGSIVVEETNYNYQVGRVTRATIPAAAVGNFYYIH